MADTNRNEPFQRGLGAAFDELSERADDFQDQLAQLDTAIAALQESTEELRSRKAAESDSLTTLADNLSPQSPVDSDAMTGVAPAADD